MKKLLLVTLLATPFFATASHIVGGEFELLHLSGYNYQLNLIIYFDVLNGNAGAKDANATVYIYRKSDNLLMGTVLLPLTSEGDVSYTQPSCSNGELVTRRLLYTATTTLSPNSYNDPQGYYLVWERCCRNYSITNIYSENPQQAGAITAGQTFYLEFPSVTKNGQQFINSSPHLFPPLNDYACPYRPYYVNFAGVDDDNDSLVYSLVTPLNTSSADALPAPAPAPYPEVLWRPGYGLTNIIGGLPDLRISRDGFLTATPRTQGLYVFAVKVDEYRNGIKIGESRRDFQMLVVDQCAHDEAPIITGKKLADASFGYVNTMNVAFSNAVDDANRCIQVSVSDPDSNNPADNYTENVTIKVIGINFKSTKLNEVLPAVTTATLTHGSTADFSICFPQCPFVNGPYQVGILVFDDACSLPLSDTLKVTVTVQPPANTPAYFIPPKITTAQLYEGGNASWSFQAKDDDLDTLVVSLLTDNFVLKDAGMTFTILDQQQGFVAGTLSWDAYCDIYDFTKRTNFQVTIQVDDKDVCNLNGPDHDVYNLSVKLPDISPPIIDTDLTTSTHERRVTLQRKIFDSLDFKVTGKEQSGANLLALNGAGVKFNMSNYGALFPPATGNGLVSSDFSWKILCNTLDLKKTDSLIFEFVVTDNTNKCHFALADTVDVHVKIAPPDDIAPIINISTATSGNITDGSIEFIRGTPIILDVLGTDADFYPDKDNLTLTLTSATGSVQPTGYSFKGSTGKGIVESLFTWTPDCSIFDKGIFENSYVFHFKVADDRCQNAKQDTVYVKIKVKDIVSSESEIFLPTAFTPNGDNHNDYFALEGYEECIDCVESPLPPDNCARSFKAVRIYNRWGGLVFKSTDRQFRWYADGDPDGVYYYIVEFTDKNYKSYLSVYR